MRSTWVTSLRSGMPSIAARLILMTCLAACDAPSSPDAGGPRVLDSGAPPPPAPVCEGSPVACGEHSLSTCDDVPGCAPSAECAGFTSCGQPDRASCEAVRGCRWEMNLYCLGTAASCSTYGYQLECAGAGCDWLRGDECEGSPRPCADLSESECVRAPGCRVITGGDAGAADAGESDAGESDAGAGVCDPSAVRDCHPYYDRSCGCEYSTSDARFACGRAGTVREGGDCDDFGQCAGGLICHRGLVGDVGECRMRCESDAQCDPGEVCAFIDEDFGAPCTGLCLPESECSMVTQGCPGGEGCYLVVDRTADRAYSFCHPAGTTEAGDFCIDGNSISCLPGLLCAQDPIRSYSWNCQPLCTSEGECDVLSDCTGMTAGFMHCR